VTLASIPSPSQSVWNIGPFPLRAYALCIIAGVIAAVVISDRRMQARGGPKGAIMDIAVYAVPAGIIGARIYHVITSPQSYFGEGGDPIAALKIWEGGLGIWGAIAGGALGAWYAARRLGIPLRVVADVVAPGLAVAQALGRFGNWFNQELFGKPTDLPWALEIEPGRPSTIPGELTYHPTFLYETLWCLGVAAFVIWAERRFKLGRGRVFALYVMAYVVGRLWIEALRIDEANHILGLRLNIWTCMIVFSGALWYFLTHSGPREQLVTSEDGTVRVLPEGETVPEPSDEAGDEATSEASQDDTSESDAPEDGTEPDDADASTSAEPKKS
jgi:prolipoprotein diacylglyceryl transferase